MGATNDLSVEFASASGDTIVFANTPDGAQTRRLTAIAVPQSQTVHKRWTLMKHETVPASANWQSLPTPMESLVTIKEAGHGIVAWVSISVLFSAGVVEFRCQLGDVSLAYYVLDEPRQGSANLSYSGSGVSFHAASGPLQPGTLWGAQGLPLPGVPKGYYGYTRTNRYPRVLRGTNGYPKGTTGYCAPHFAFRISVNRRRRAPLPAARRSPNRPQLFVRVVLQANERA
jgi:hypothetical protein